MTCISSSILKNYIPCRLNLFKLNTNTTTVNPPVKQNNVFFSKIKNSNPLTVPVQSHLMSKISVMINLRVESININIDSNITDDQESA